jgi:hypothetical protein
MGPVLALLPWRHAGWSAMSSREKLYDATDLASWYQLGIEHERERAAGAEVEHEQAWRQLGERISEARRQEMLRTFARCAEDFHRRELGRGYVPFTGRSA